MEICLHCHAAPASRPRGLCARCYKDTAIRERYAKRPSVPSHETEPPPETEEEVEALVERQRECLPAWWEHETRRMRMVDG